MTVVSQGNLITNYNRLGMMRQRSARSRITIVTDGSKAAQTFNDPLVVNFINQAFIFMTVDFFTISNGNAAAFLAAML